MLPLLILLLLHILTEERDFSSAGAFEINDNNEQEDEDGSA